MIGSIKNFLQKKGSDIPEKEAVEAYDLWSASYDLQAGNLMLDLDEIVFADLLQHVHLKNKRIADIGCGTGRHWQKLYDRKPGIVLGFDVSEGMLLQLKRKFPDALTLRTTGNRLDAVPALFIDCIVSTLTLAHIKNIDEAILAWSGILKNGGDLLLTDFHPELLAKGGKRSFRHEGRRLTVVNYIHPLDEIKSVCEKHGLMVIREEQKYIDASVKHYYEAQHALAVYDRFKGLPVIYGLHLKKQDVAE